MNTFYQTQNEQHKLQLSKQVPKDGNLTDPKYESVVNYGVRPNDMGSSYYARTYV
jgi:hypothetical protein